MSDTMQQAPKPRVQAPPMPATDGEPTLTPEQLAGLRAELLAELRFEGRVSATGGRARRILDALDRWSAGTYGRCLACRRPIPFARLEAIPETPTCVECSWAHELTHH